MRAMRRAEAIVHIDLLVARELMREVAIVGLLFFVEAQIFQQENIAIFQRRNFPLRFFTDAISCESYSLA